MEKEQSIEIKTNLYINTSKSDNFSNDLKTISNLVTLQRNILKYIFDYLEEDQILDFKNLHNRKLYRILISEYFNKKTFYSEATQLRIYSIYTEDYLMSSNPFKLVSYYDNQNDLLLAYINNNGELIINSLLKNEIIDKKKFYNYPSSLFHHKDKNNQYLSIISDKQSIILLNVQNNYEKQLEIHFNECITSFLMFNNEIENTVYFVISSSFSEVYDMQGKLVKIIGKSKKNKVLYSEIFFHPGKKDYILISLNIDCIILFSFSDCSIYLMLLGDLNSLRYSCLVYQFQDDFYLVESSYKGILTFWDLESNYIIEQIKLKFSNFVSMLKWDTDMFIVSNFCAIDIVSFSKREILKTINNCHSGQIVTLCKVLHPNLWEILFTGGDDGTIKIWTI